MASLCVNFRYSIEALLAPWIRELFAVSSRAAPETAASAVAHCAGRSKKAGEIKTAGPETSLTSRDLQFFNLRPFARTHRESFVFRGRPAGDRLGRGGPFAMPGAAATRRITVSLRFALWKGIKSALKFLIAIA